MIYMYFIIIFYIFTLVQINDAFLKANQAVAMSCVVSTHAVHAPIAKQDNQQILSFN